MIHYFPLEHIPNRYTTHLDRDVLEYLELNKIPYIYYEPKTPNGDKSVSNGNFLNAVDTVYRQSYQMTQFLENWSKGKVNDGDIVFIKACPEVDNGQIAAVSIDNEVTLKRVYYYPEKNKLVLSPENPKYEPFVYTNEELDDIRILGKAVMFLSLVK